MTIIKQQLREAGLKVTGPRLKILNILRDSSSRHLSAEEVYKVLKSTEDETGLATVYRVLTQLESVGIVKRQHFEDAHSVFELNEGEPHDHLVCTHCGLVHEFVDPIILAQMKATANKASYEIRNHTLIIYGICAHCVHREK